jgi:hypothetical protein
MMRVSSRPCPVGIATDPAAQALPASPSSSSFFVHRRGGARVPGHFRRSRRLPLRSTRAVDHWKARLDQAVSHRREPYTARISLPKSRTTARPAPTSSSSRRRLRTRARRAGRDRPPVRNVNRTVGTMLGSVRRGASGFPMTRSRCTARFGRAGRAFPGASRCASRATPTTTRQGPVGRQAAVPPTAQRSSRRGDIIAGNVALRRASVAGPGGAVLRAQLGCHRGGRRSRRPGCGT